jgi:hypothetical protein
MIFFTKERVQMYLSNIASKPQSKFIIILLLKFIQATEKDLTNIL